MKPAHEDHDRNATQDRDEERDRDATQDRDEEHDRSTDQRRARQGGQRAEEHGPEDQEAQEQAMAERIAVPRYDVVAATMEAIGEAIAGAPTDRRPGPEGAADAETGRPLGEGAERPRRRLGDHERQHEEQEEDRARMARDSNDLLIEQDIDETVLPLERLDNPENRG
jgi:hypothetical protein